MPTLQFKGKNIIWNHHLSVPYHTLEEVSKLHFQPEKARGNLIIEGDNLLALKALLPMYAGKVKCICIDPPYNTGNEGWIYNDKVNSPLIKDWLDKEVGKDDLTRHDKWLCMMTPRLKLLRELLADDGVIFVNIDDNEVHHLRSLMDELFGEENFVNLFTIKSNPRGSQASKHIALEHEYLVMYSKNISQTEILGYSKSEDELSEYNLTDEKGRKYRLLGLRQRGGAWRREQRPNLYFPIYVNPENGNVSLEKSNTFCKKALPKRPSGEEGRWTWSKEKMKNNMHLLVGKKVSRIGESDFWDIFRKDYLESEDGITTTKKPKSIWDEKELNYQNGSNELKELFGSSEIFEYPKPTFLVKKALQILDLDEGIILDSFSGSGTTGHAVMDLNKEDGGNRKFILVQMTEATKDEPNKNICKDITRERIKMAIEKYGYDGGFQYLRVGQPLDTETLLEGNLPEYKIFAKYIYYLCTGENLKEENKISEKRFFVGNFGKQAVYLIYKQDFEKLTRMALNLEVAEKIIAEQPNKKRIVYAPACFLDEEYMEAKQIEFVSIPYNLFQRKTG